MHAERPSLTAIEVARGLLMLDARPEVGALLPLGAAAATRALLEAADLLPPWQRRLMASRRFRRIVEFIDRRTAPGTTLMLGLRKRFFDDETAAAVESGAEELIVLGAGFDTLALRWARRIPRLRAIEIDHPATSKMKRRALERTGAPDNLALVAADLSLRSLPEVLAESSTHRPGAPCFVVAEGLLMYLREPDVQRLFADLHAATGPGSAVGFSYLEEATLARQLGRLQRLTQVGFSLIGEDLHWTIAGADLQSFLEPTGWTYHDEPRFTVRRYLKDTPLAGEATGAERVAIAVRS